jgi:hypothetical protein
MLEETREVMGVKRRTIAEREMGEGHLTVLKSSRVPAK